MFIMSLDWANGICRIIGWCDIKPVINMEIGMGIELYSGHGTVDDR